MDDTVFQIAQADNDPIQEFSVGSADIQLVGSSKRVSTRLWVSNFGDWKVACTCRQECRCYQLRIPGSHPIHPMRKAGMSRRLQGRHGLLSFTLTVLTLATWPTLSCGPWFPNMMLMDGDETLLRAPFSNFDIEINRIRTPGAGFQAVLSTDGLPKQTAATEIIDLAAALEKSGLPTADRERVMLEFQAVRETLQIHAEALEQWANWNRPAEENPRPRPAPAALSVPSDLPAEFADYLQGSIAFHAGDTNSARRAWQQLLQRPALERRQRSTWAAFMLGKTWLTEDPGKATRYFDQVQDLARHGFADSLGLAAASYGWQAKIELDRGNYISAIRLYLTQHRTGDPTAVLSLRFIARKISTMAPDELDTLALDPLSRQVITAYIVSRRSLTESGSADETTAIIRGWLETVQRAGAQEVESADRLALAAYQRGLYELAADWLQRARTDSAMAQWLRAKLFLRAGNVEKAAKLLAQVIHLFPREGDWPDPVLRGDPHFDQAVVWDDESPVRQAMGEMRVLHLARREYYEALDTLLRAGYWSDAAYIAEYVLTPEELIAYVDRQWPAPETSPDAVSGAQQSYLDGQVSPLTVAVELRYLVARRLARLQRWNEATEFYPAKWRTRLELFLQHLGRGVDASLPAPERAEALWQAALIARLEGMELFGTEVEPDWHLFAGQFDLRHVSSLRGVSPDEGGRVKPGVDPRWDSNSDPVSMKLAPGSLDEQRRLAAHRAKPDLRFHYRYYAADLAWQAAQLMPNDTDETARVLWRAGTWLKARDPQAADRFYKALVRHCRHTALGQAADQLRWFPMTDTPEPPAEPAEAAPVPDPAIEQPATQPQPESTPSPDRLAQ
jgi:tetratricopeptide (TPR) repeat protein